jgi:hypothetical protein
MLACMAWDETLTLTRDEELALLFRALPRSLPAASLSRSPREKGQLDAIVGRIKEIQRQPLKPGDY